MILPSIQATEALRITGAELQKLDVVDEVILEPLGGAHSDPGQTSKNIKAVIMKHMRNLLKLEPGTLMQQRVAKFRKMGAVEENVEVDPHIKRNMKKREVPLESDEPKLLLAGNEQPIDFKNKNSLPVNASANNSTRE
jgi:acetyl-CoA carboxylase carboxyl transferase subunit alpha